MNYLDPEYRKIFEDLAGASLLLLSEASDLIERDEPNSDRLAVILAHAACDVQTEQTLSDLCAARGIDYLTEALIGSRGAQTSLHIDHVRKIFIALSGDNPTEQSWWPRWRSSIERRNKVAHSAALPIRDDAVATYNCCEQYIVHLIKVAANVSKNKAK
jgi:hypothetical protein